MLSQTVMLSKKKKKKVVMKDTYDRSHKANWQEGKMKEVLVALSFLHSLSIEKKSKESGYVYIYDP
jgi:hypothetical protein